MKKKVLTVCLVAVIAIMAVAGASLAYLTDTDAEDNVFTVGNVQIDLTEDFTQNSKLLPATGSAQDGTLVNGVKKEVFVTNTGSEDAYVRVHIAIPEALDSGSPIFDPSQNILHFNFAKDSIGANKWNWSKSLGSPYDANWNYYTPMINDIKYGVYVVTYEKALTPEEKTVSAMSQVYLDPSVANEDITELCNELGNEWHMYVVAEGVQAAGFANAYDALNRSFGTPGAYDVAWPANNQ